VITCPLCDTPILPGDDAEQIRCSCCGSVVIPGQTTVEVTRAQTLDLEPAVGQPRTVANLADQTLDSPAPALAKPPTVDKLLDRTIDLPPATGDHGSEGSSLSSAGTMPTIDSHIAGSRVADSAGSFAPTLDSSLAPLAAVDSPAKSVIGRIKCSQWRAEWAAGVRFGGDNRWNRYARQGARVRRDVSCAGRRWRSRWADWRVLGRRAPAGSRPASPPNPGSAGDSSCR
jgi:hypothetical protein